MRVRPTERSFVARGISSLGATALGVTLLVLGSSALAQQPDAPASTSPAAGAQTAGGSSDTTAADTEIQAWPGTFADGFAQIRAFAEKQQLESAARVADALLAPNAFLRKKLAWSERGGWRAHVVAAVDPLLDLAGWNGLEPDVRAEVWYAKGVVATLAKDREAAEADFWKARGMTSDPSLQRDSIYDLGSLALQAGEAERAKLPEISGKPAAPAMPSPAGPGAPNAAPGAAQPPDPLQLAREAYLQARERFVERLRADWHDADTQANVELCLKRLRELDDIEKKRKEEEQKKKDEEKKKQDQQNKDQDKDKDKKNQDGKDKQKDPQKDQQQKDDEKKEPEKPKDEDKKKQDEKKPDQPKDENDKEAEKKKKDAQPTEKQDAQMSPEEMTQLLDRLQRIEDEHKKIEAQLRAMRRAKVKKDW